MRQEGRLSCCPRSVPFGLMLLGSGVQAVVLDLIGVIKLHVAGCGFENVRGDAEYFNTVVQIAVMKVPRREADQTFCVFQWVF